MKLQIKQLGSKDLISIALAAVLVATATLAPTQSALAETAGVI